MRSLPCRPCPHLRGARANQGRHLSPPSCARHTGDLLLQMGEMGRGIRKGEISGRGDNQLDIREITAQLAAEGFGRARGWGQRGPGGGHFPPLPLLLELNRD